MAITLSSLVKGPAKNVLHQIKSNNVLRGYTHISTFVCVQTVPPDETAQLVMNLSDATLY